MLAEDIALSLAKNYFFSLSKQQILVTTTSMPLDPKKKMTRKNDKSYMKKTIFFRTRSCNNLECHFQGLNKQNTKLEQS